MAKKPTSRKPRKSDVKAAADRAEARAEGKPVEEPKVQIDPEIVLAEEIAKRGRPSTYKPEYVEQASMLCKLGATDEEIARFFKVSVRTLYRWKAQFPEFCQAIKISGSEADERVERSLYARAVGYTFDAVKIMQHQGVPLTVKYKEHVPPDIGAVCFWLKNRKPEVWRDISKHEVGKPGDFDRMSKDELTEYIRTETEALGVGHIAAQGSGRGGKARSQLN